MTHETITPEAMPAAAAPVQHALGIHLDVPPARYHADDFGPVPTLSSSIAKVLLGRTPLHAFTAHPRLNAAFEADDDSKFDLGSAAHEMILGRGAGIDVHDFDSWRKKEAQAAREITIAAGRIPMLREQHERAHEIARAAWAHPHAPYVVGDAEVLVLWRDAGGPLCRALLDHLTIAEDGRRALITDCKITDVALNDGTLARQIVNMGYDLSAGFYIRGLVATRPELAGRVQFRWHFVEATAPFGSRMIEATGEQLQIGDRKAGLAIATWQRCLAAGQWPAWPGTVDRLEMPAWYEGQQIEAEAAHPDAHAAVFADRVPTADRVKLMEPV